MRIYFQPWITIYSDIFLLKHKLHQVFHSWQTWFPWSKISSIAEIIPIALEKLGIDSAIKQIFTPHSEFSLRFVLRLTANPIETLSIKFWSALFLRLDVIRFWLENWPEKRVKQTEIRRKGKQSKTGARQTVALANSPVGFNSDLFCFVSSILLTSQPEEGCSGQPKYCFKHTTLYHWALQ